MKVLVCGGRTWGVAPVIQMQSLQIQQRTAARVTMERQKLFYTLHGRGITEIIHGGARGADSVAGEWARANGVKETCVRADWDTHGKAAGPIRNSEMLKLKPDLVIAFPGGVGTADMVRKARAAGVPVEEKPT